MPDTSVWSSPQSPDSFPRVQMPSPQGSSCRCTALTGTLKNRSAATSDTGQVSVVLETIGLSSVMVPLAEPAVPEMVAPDAELSVTVRVPSSSSVESLAVAMERVSAVLLPVSSAWWRLPR